MTRINTSASFLLTAKIGDSGHQVLEAYSDVRWVLSFACSCLGHVPQQSWYPACGRYCCCAKTGVCKQTPEAVLLDAGRRGGQRLGKSRLCPELFKRSTCSRPNVCSGAAARAGAGLAPLRSGAAAEAAVATAAGSGGVAAGAGVGAAAAATMGEKHLSCPETLSCPSCGGNQNLPNPRPPARPPSAHENNDNLLVRQPASGLPARLKRPASLTRAPQDLEKEATIRFRRPRARTEAQRRSSVAVLPPSCLVSRVAPFFRRLVFSLVSSLPLPLVAYCPCLSCLSFCPRGAGCSALALSRPVVSCPVLSCSSGHDKSSSHPEYFSRRLSICPRLQIARMPSHPQHSAWPPRLSLVSCRLVVWWRLPVPFFKSRVAKVFTTM